MGRTAATTATAAGLIVDEGQRHVDLGVLREVARVWQVERAARAIDATDFYLRDLVNATVGFESLAEEIQKPAKSLHRMLSTSGNPSMSNISVIFAAIKRALKVEIHTRVVMT